MKPGSAIAGAATLLLAVACACTERDTGYIDLAASAAPSASIAPPLPVPECVADVDCIAPGRPRCDPTLNRCVECLAATDCEGGLACASDRACKR